MKIKARDLRWQHRIVLDDGTFVVVIVLSRPDADGRLVVHVGNVDVKRDLRILRFDPDEEVEIKP